MQKKKTALLSYGMSGKVFHALFWNYILVLNCWALGDALKINTTGLPSSYVSNIANNTRIRCRFGCSEYSVGTHFEFAKQVLQSGKHAIVEKHLPPQ
jgi:hypothetical protein